MFFSRIDRLGSGPSFAERFDHFRLQRGHELLITLVGDDGQNVDLIVKVRCPCWLTTSRIPRPTSWRFFTSETV